MLPHFMGLAVIEPVRPSYSNQVSCSLITLYVCPFNRMAHTANTWVVRERGVARVAWVVMMVLGII
jgi:hypothetical protein